MAIGKKLAATLLAGACMAFAGGTISGTVKVKGEAPKDEIKAVNKDAEQCGAKMPAQKYVVSASGGVKWAVAMLENAPQGKKLPGGEMLFDNKNCKFEPHVMLAPTGGELKVKNSDDMLHNAHFYLLEGDKKKNLVNMALPKKDQVIANKRVLRKSGLISAECDAHAFMQGYIWSLDHGYAAVTGADGGFTITDVPAGSYKLKIWHEALGEKVLDVKVEDGKDAKVNVEL